jgi:hypothetical protein
MAWMRRARRRDRERVAASACAQAQAQATHARHEPSGPAASLLRLHRDFGNQSVQRLMRATLLERKSASLASETQSRDARLGVEEAAASREHELERQSSKEMALPAKATTEAAEEMEQDKPRPMNGGASIQCDGSGDYEITYGSYATAACGTKDCVTAHENSHIEDWKAKWPNGCKNQPSGYVPKGDPPDEVLMTVAEYKAFLKASECKAHTADLKCAKALPKPEGCGSTVRKYIRLTRRQKRKWC